MSWIFSFSLAVTLMCQFLISQQHYDVLLGLKCSLNT